MVPPSFLFIILSFFVVAEGVKRDVPISLVPLFFFFFFEEVVPRHVLPSFFFLFTGVLSSSGGVEDADVDRCRRPVRCSPFFFPSFLFFISLSKT